MRPGGALTLTLATTVLGLGVGHVLRTRGEDAEHPGGREAGWIEAERRLDAIEARPPSAPDEGLRRLDSRVAALEASGPPAAGTGAVDRSLEDLRTALAEIRRREAAERRTDWLRRLLEGAAPDLSPDTRRDALARLEAFAKEVDALHPAGSAGATAEERAATSERVKAARVALEADLRALVPADAVARILAQLPGR